MSEVVNVNVITFSDNLITGDDGIVTSNDVTLDQDGFFSFFYYFLQDKNELSAANGYDVLEAGENPQNLSLQSIEYATFSQTIAQQRSIFTTIFHGGGNNSYAVYYSDVVSNLRFFQGGANTAHINIGQMEWDSDGDGPNEIEETDADGNGIHESIQNPVPGDRFVGGKTIEQYNLNDPTVSQFKPLYPYSSDYGEKAQSDIWLNSNWLDDWNENSLGGTQFYTVMHEIGHSLGLKHPEGSDIDNLKFTIMSDQPIPGFGIDILPSNLQLYDILAIQEIFQSRNYNKLSGNTTYGLNAGFSDDPDTAFIYTIWDGGGTDTVSASGFYEGDLVPLAGAEIDLRQGHFSSIGPAGTGAPHATENVAVAFFTVIENAVGSVLEDILIGNAWDNRLEGGAGDDFLYGDGIVYDGDSGFLGVDDGNGGFHDPLRAWDPVSNPEYDANLSGDDVLTGGEGSDHLYGGSGRDTADYSHDAENGGNAGIKVDLDVNGDGTAVDGFGDTDSLFSIEIVNGTAVKDEYTLDVPSGLTINGNGGEDVVTYSGSIVWDQNTGRVWNLEGTAYDTLEGITDVRYGSGTLLPDYDSSAIVRPYRGVPFNYSAAETSVSFGFTLEGHIGFSTLSRVFPWSGARSASASAGLDGGVGHSIHSFGWQTFHYSLPRLISELFEHSASAITATGGNLGDTVNIGRGPSSLSFAVPPPPLSFFAGNGNDTITIQNGMEPADITLGFRGGIDTVQNGQSVDRVIMWEGISQSDVTITQGAGGIVFDAGSFGSLTSQGAAALPQISWLAGTGNAVHGTWGMDFWTSRTDTAQTFYGKAANDNTGQKRQPAGRMAA